MKKKKQKGGFLSVILGISDASLLGNMLAGKGVNRAVYGSRDPPCKGAKGIIRAVFESKLDF